MKVGLKLITQDPATRFNKGQGGIEGFYTEKQEYFLDGPICRRVAVIDFDSNGTLFPGTPFIPPSGDRKVGRYAVRDSKNLQSRDFNQVSVFSTVLKTMYMFEDEDALGRELRWAFDAPQLLVVPRAGERANAYYERDSHSVQFFYFSPESSPGRTIYTSLSHDIVAHETGHAILDGIAPDLFNSVSPQSLALHESTADLIALVMAFRSNVLPKVVLAKTNGSIREASAFSWLAEEYGQARDAKGGRKYLRSMLNEKTLNLRDFSYDENDEWNQVDRKDPHALSQVLSGALYAVMVKIHEKMRSSFAEREGKTEYSMSGKALAVAAERFKRLLFRALDYLPPGEISFADYGRAILASDQASHPYELDEREWIKEEFSRRCMIDEDSELEVETNFEHPSIAQLDLQALVESDWAAYEFANQHREFLGIPEKVHFQVRPRLDVTKLYYLRDGKKRVRECIFKVSWDVKEPNRRLRDAGFPSNRQITAGITLAIDWESRRVRVLLKSDLARSGEPDVQLRKDRDAFLEMLAGDGLLQDGKEHRAQGPWVETANQLMRLRRSANLLHLVEGGGGSNSVVTAPEDYYLTPPAGVDTGAFFNLVERRRSLAATNIKKIQSDNL